MSRRIDKSWVVLRSIENGEHDRCVDLFRRPDCSFGFEEFRRDVEDAGAWTPVAYYSGAAYSSTAFTMLKIAALAPMPNARTATTASVNEGARDKMRRP